MPVTINLLPSEPIIIATLKGEITVDEVVYLFRRSAEIMGDFDGLFYRITDVTDITVSFADLLRIVAEGSKNVPGTSTDPRIKVHFVGTDAMAKLYVDFLKQQRNGGVQIPMHKRMDEALRSIRLEMTAQRKAV